MIKSKTTIIEHYFTFNKWSKHNRFETVLLLINTVSFVFSIVYCFRYRWRPLFGINIQVANSLMDLFLNISLGILVSSFFYLIVSYIPSKVLEKKAAQIIEPNIKNIIQSTNNIIDKVIWVGENIYGPQFAKEICNSDDRMERFKFLFSIVQTNDQTDTYKNIFTHTTNSISEFTVHQAELIVENLEVIRTTNLASLNIDYMILVSELQNSNFIQITRRKTIQSLAQQNSNFDWIRKPMLEFNELVIRLENQIK